MSRCTRRRWRIRRRPSSMPRWARIGRAEGLEGTVAANVLAVAGGDVRFVHPLLAAAAYGRASPGRRRSVHERLAEVVTEPEERARHLSRAVVGADESVARALEDGSTVAARRGASEVAAELAEEAARLTPVGADDERHRRRLVAADHLIVSGDMRRADEILGVGRCRARGRTASGRRPDPTGAPGPVSLGRSSSPRRCFDRRCR